MKIKEICVYFLFLFMEFLILDTRLIFKKKVTGREAPILVITSQNGTLTIPHGLSQVWQYLSCNFEKNPFLSGVTVSENWRRKGIKVTFVSFDLRAVKFTVACKEYGNTLFWYFWHFHIRFVEFYFGFKDYRVFAVPKASNCTPVFLISIWLSLEKIDKKNFS